MKKIITKIFLGLLISSILLIHSVEIMSFNTTYIFKSIQNKVTLETYGIDETDLGLITNELTQYLKNNTDDLIFTITQNGQKTQAFEDRELKHMVDVQNIYILLNRIKYLFYAIIGSFFLWNKKRLLESFSYAFILSLSFILGIGISVFLFFNKAFILFHKLSFNNDLWLLDPKTDLMIQLLPLSFFKEIALFIVSIFLILNIILMIFYKFIKKRTRPL